MMESVLSNSSKVMVDVEGGSNLMYLPLDKLMSRTTSAAPMSDMLGDAQQRDLMDRVKQQANTRSRSTQRTRETR
jgi:membrane protease subunit HflK